MLVHNVYYMPSPDGNGIAGKIELKADSDRIELYEGEEYEVFSLRYDNRVVLNKYIPRGSSIKV